MSALGPNLRSVLVSASRIYPHDVDLYSCFESLVTIVSLTAHLEFEYTVPADTADSGFLWLPEGVSGPRHPDHHLM